MDSYFNLIIAISGLITITTPIIVGLYILRNSKRSVSSLNGTTLSLLTLETDYINLLRMIMYVNGFFAGLVIGLSIFLANGSVIQSILLSFLITGLFWSSGYCLVPNSKIYPYHTLISTILFFYLILLKFYFGFLLFSPPSLIMGCFDLIIVAGFLIFNKGKINFWVEILFGINLAFWVFFIFVIPSLLNILA